MSATLFFEKKMLLAVLPQLCYCSATNLPLALTMHLQNSNNKTLPFCIINFLNFQVTL